MLLSTWKFVLQNLPQLLIKNLIALRHDWLGCAGQFRLFLCVYIDFRSFLLNIIGLVLLGEGVAVRGHMVEEDRATRGDLVDLR